MILWLACSSAVDHGAPPTDDPREAWDVALQTAVQDDGTVDYDTLRADPAPLDAYVAWLAEDQGFAGDALFAHRINAYNAFTLAGVLDRWPIASVRDVRVGVLGLGGAGFFVGLKFELAGVWMSLKTLEDDHLRAAFSDHRVHAAINCASAGCPTLRDGLFSPEHLDAQLDEAMKRFIETRVRVDGDEVVLSQIFEWFAEDFPGETPCHVLAAVDSSYQGMADSGCPHRFEPYDWSLNARAAPPR